MDGGNKSYDLTLSWKATATDLRPIDSFFITIIAGGRQTEENGNIVNRPPKTYDSSVDGNTTQYTVIDILLADEYIVQVCSQNRQGMNCSASMTYTPPTSGLGMPEDRDRDELPAGAILAIVFLVLFVLCFGCCFLLLFCFICCWPDEWRSYHPKKKGKLHTLTIMYIKALLYDISVCSLSPTEIKNEREFKEYVRSK